MGDKATASSAFSATILVSQVFMYILGLGEYMALSIMCII